MARLPEWDAFKHLMGPERTLPDGRVEGTTTDDWQAVLDAIEHRS